MSNNTSIKFRSGMTVKLIKATGSDNDIVWAARVSTQGEDSLAQLDKDPEQSKGLIRYLIRNRHASPLEHSSFTFYIETPIFVMREIARHRVASYNEESGRYKELEGVFYMPSSDRDLVQVGKTGNYEFHAGSHEQYDSVVESVREISSNAFMKYRQMLDDGIAKEVARIVLPVNIYTSLYMTVNARALMNFLSLRTKSDNALIPSHPQREIEMVAEQMESIFKKHMPLAWEAWNDSGRGSP